MYSCLHSASYNGGYCANEVQRELLFFLGICKIACTCVFHLCMNLCVCRPDDPIVFFNVRQMADSRDSSFQHVGTGT